MARPTLFRLRDSQACVREWRGGEGTARSLAGISETSHLTLWR